MNCQFVIFFLKYTIVLHFYKFRFNIILNFSTPRGKKKWIMKNFLAVCIIFKNIVLKIWCGPHWEGTRDARFIWLLWTVVVERTRVSLVDVFVACVVYLTQWKPLFPRRSCKANRRTPVLSRPSVAEDVRNPVPQRLRPLRQRLSGLYCKSITALRNWLRKCYEQRRNEAWGLVVRCIDTILEGTKQV